MPTLALFQIFNWLPEVYNDQNTLPKHMPKDLQEHITTLISSGKQNVSVVNGSKATVFPV
jgi:hypothetical protein